MYHTCQLKLKVMSRNELKFLANSKSHLLMTKIYPKIFSPFQYTLAINLEL